MQAESHYLEPRAAHNADGHDDHHHGLKRENSFLTAPEGGWLHNQFALQYGEGVFFSFPVTYVGRIEMSKSLRTVEFPIRHRICQEAIARVREAAHTRDPIERDVDSTTSRFLDRNDADVRMQDIVLNISVEGIVLATPEEENVIAHHRMTCISYACGGDFEDYEQVAYVAKTRLGRICYIFDCGAYSNQVLATLGQAFVTAGEMQAIEDEEYEDLDEEYNMYQDQYDGMTQQEYEDLYGQPTEPQAYANYGQPDPTGANYSSIDERTYAMAAPEYAASAPIEANGGAYADVDMEADPQAYAMAMGNPGGHYTDAHVIEADNGAYHDVNELIEEAAMYNMAAKESHYSDATMTEANPNYHEVSPDVEPEYDMGDPTSSTYALAADVKTKTPQRRQAPKPPSADGQQYCMAATVKSEPTDVAPEQGGVNYAMAAKESPYSTASHLANVMRKNPGRKGGAGDNHYSMADDASRRYSRLDSRANSTGSAIRREIEEEDESSDEDTEVITVRSAGPRSPSPQTVKTAPPVAAKPTQPVKQSSLEDDNGWAELAMRDAPSTDRGYIEGNYLEGGEDDGNAAPTPPPVAGIQKAKKQTKKQRKAEDKSSYLKISPRKGSGKRKGLFGKLKKNKASSSPKMEDYMDVGDQEVPEVEAIDYSRIAEADDGAYSQADELAGSDNELGHSADLDEAEAEYQARKERLRTESVYSKPERQQPPKLPEKSGTEVDLLRESIQAKPLKSKADLLVRKLNAQGRSPSGMLNPPATPNWNYIDPENLEEVDEH
eukprot:m.156146 g.156146  ORF g.156146 m.156146 type:complete len:778 (-) comp16431_c0_seq2:103-2436(-)